MKGALQWQASWPETPCALAITTPSTVLEAIRKLRAQTKVGDGATDAPTMANATVGSVMGAAGSDVTLETADVALMADRRAHLPFAVGLSRHTRNCNPAKCRREPRCRPCRSVSDKACVAQPARNQCQSSAASPGPRDAIGIIVRKMTSVSA